MKKFSKNNEDFSARVGLDMSRPTLALALLIRASTKKYSRNGFEYD